MRLGDLLTSFVVGDDAHTFGQMMGVPIEAYLFFIFWDN